MSVTAIGGPAVAAASPALAAQAAPVQDASTQDAPTDAPEGAGQPHAATSSPKRLPQMASEDFLALHVASQEGPQLTLAKMLEWLLAIKLLEATSKDGG